MRRLLGIALVAALAVAAATAPRPEAAEPFVVDVDIQPDLRASARSTVWYCTWVESGAETDGVLAMASIPAAVALATFPSPIPNAPPDVERFDLDGPGAVIVDLGTIVRRGAAPGFVEFTEGPAAATTFVTSETGISGDQCVASAPKQWHLAGATTRDGASLTLRLFNPFPDNAKVTIEGLSEFGNVPFPELESFDVDGRSWRDVDLVQLVPFLDDLALTVRNDDGLVIPALALRLGSDEATWPGTGLSTTWEFPVTGLDATTAELILFNTGDTDVTASLDIYTAQGATPDAATVTVSRSAPLRIDLSVYAVGPAGVRVRADGPLAATVVAQSPNLDEAVGGDADAVEAPPAVRLGATVGAAAPANRWILPGAGAIPDAGSVIWILNSGDADATVTVLPLGGGGVDKLTVPAGTLGRYLVGLSESIDGYVIDASSPVSVAWSASAERGIVYVAGIAVEE